MLSAEGWAEPRGSVSMKAPPTAIIWRPWFPADARRRSHFHLVGLCCLSTLTIWPLAFSKVRDPRERQRDKQENTGAFLTQSNRQNSVIAPRFCPLVHRLCVTTCFGGSAGPITMMGSHPSHSTTLCGRRDIAVKTPNKLTWS